jgi:alpha-mannosidase
MLFNQTHDLMSGVMTDRVFDDTMRGFDFSKRIAHEEIQARWQDVSTRINTQGEGIAIGVFNALGWPRTDLAVANVGFGDSDIADVRLVGPDGQAVPVQVLSSERYASGSLVRAEVAFVARDVPPLGYAVYRLIPQRSPAAAGAAKPQSEPVLENEHYRLEMNPAGAITRLLVKAGNWDALAEPGNVVAREEDRGDLWEPYRPLDGGSRIAMKTQVVVPQPGKAVFSSDQAAPAGTVSRGPVVSEFKVAHPFGTKGSFATAVRLYAGLRRIDIRTQIVNQEQFVRYRAMFPTSIRDGQSVHEIPFGAFHRPAGIEFPAQNWIDWGNGQRGVALLNRGLPGNVVSGGTMMLSLLRSTRIVAYGFGGGYEPGMGSDSGFELGKELTFDYALVPHVGDWRQAAIYREGLEFNHPLLTHTMAVHSGPLPDRWGFLDIAPQNLVLSTFKPGPDGTAVLRVYEAAGKPTAAKIRLSAQVLAAEEVNLMEDPGRTLAVADNTLQLDFRPFEIKTVKFRLQPIKGGP